MEKCLILILILMSFQRTSCEDDDIITSVHLLTQPTDIVDVKIGQTVHLSCKFDAEVFCFWWHNQSHVAQTKNEKFNSRSSDCSLTIESVNPTSAGEWYCSSKGTSEVAHVESNRSRISLIDGTIAVKISPLNVIIHPGKTVYLNCHFHDRVECVWKRAGRRVQIKGRYQFMSGGGTNSDDCSIKLMSSINEIDARDWACTYLANSYTNFVPIAHATLSSGTQDSKESQTVLLMIIGILILVLFLVIFGAICIIIFKCKRR